ncbi:MAG: 1-deoxy-D-xylulose-5-phosphate synthase [Peptostreptococcaceae bacterium]|nr:1-deoxy-D-xylulose-5-phosphate synthase [Peptostreptococcaceae bacterium]
MLKKKLTEYNFPEDLKTMTEKELELLPYEIRDYLIENVSKTGGHLASNLGVVELTIAIHKVFESPTDKIIWDVGHQSYIHKILTGRAADLCTIRSYEGMSGFPKRDESVHDCFETGHSSTSISAATGFAVARDLAGENHEVIAVIGDGALTGGLAYEGLNNAGDSKSKMIVILNDNGMSINKSTGAIARHLSKLRLSTAYLDLKKQLKKTLKGIPGVGEGLYLGAEHLRDSIKYAIIQGAIFEEFGFKYIGPIDGHKLKDLIETLTLAKTMDGPVFIHVLTTKGKGYKNAENNPNKFHGIGPFDPTTGVQLNSSTETSFSQVFGNKIVELAAKDDKIVVVCAAMSDGTGLEKFKQNFPDRIFDVGIAEAHAVTFAAGLAQGGLKPVVAIYSTFLQRAYDQILMDVCLQNLPVIFAIDRAGNVGQDGETHHGIFDLSYLEHMPNLTILAPKDGKELSEMLEYAISLNGPCAIRYPRGAASDVIIGSALGSDVEIWAVGKMVSIGNNACELLKKMNIDAGIINVKRIKPLDQAGILASARRVKHIVTLEDNSVIGGFGQQLSSFLLEKGILDVKVTNIGWPDKFIEHGSIEELFEKYDLDAKGVAERIRKSIER